MLVLWNSEAEDYHPDYSSSSCHPLWCLCPGFAASGLSSMGMGIGTGILCMQGVSCMNTINLKSSKHRKGLTFQDNLLHM